MAIKDDKGNWIDASGAPVPPKYVDKLDKSRDKLCAMAVDAARKLRAALEDYRAKVDAAIDAHIDLVAEVTGVPPNEGGNYTLTSFSGDQQVERKQVQYMGFDERLQSAKTLIDQCLTRMTKDSGSDLAMIVHDAFRVNEKGKINVREILAMVRRTKKVKDADWQRARAIILDATRSEGRRAYLQIRVRDAGNGAWTTIRLDLAATGAAGE